MGVQFENNFPFNITFVKIIEDLIYFSTRVPNTSNTNDTSETQTTRVQQESDTSNTSATQMRHECYTNDTSSTRVRNFEFDNDTSESIFLHPYISYMAYERIQGEAQFHSKNYLLQMPRSHNKMHLKSAPQKLNLVMAKAISKSYIPDCSCKCSCTFPRSYAQ